MLHVFSGEPIGLIQMLRFYNAVVRLWIDYGSIVCSSTKQAIRKLELVHSSALQIISSAFHSSSVSSLLAETGELSLS